jgi:hypothetical protein
MMIELVEQLWGAAQLMLNPGYVIDKFLDWIEELGGPMMPTRFDGLVCRKVRTHERPGSFGA